MELRIVNETEFDNKSWSKFIENTSAGNIFQTPEMFEVFASTKNYTPLLVAALDSKGAPAAVLMSVIQQEFSGVLGGFTTRCISWGGPVIADELTDDEQAEALQIILSEQDRVAKKKCIYMQIRNMWDTSSNIDMFKEGGYEYEDHLNILIDLTQGEDEILAAMKRDKRRGIKKAQESGMELVKVDDKSLVSNFYEMLKETYKNAKVPLADPSFFEYIYDHLVPKGYAKFFMAKLEGKFAAGRLSLYYKKKVLDWYAGDINEYVSYYPNEFLLWSILVDGKSHGYGQFDFMGAGKPDEDYGVRDWKERFGGQLADFGRYIKIYKKTKMKLAKTGLKVINKLG